MVSSTANFHLRPLQPTDNEVVRELWSTAMRSYRMPPERRWDDWITKRLEDPGDMGDPHKGYVVHGDRGFWVVEKQNEIVGCVGAIHRSWSDLKKVSYTYDVLTEWGRGVSQIDMKYGSFDQCQMQTRESKN